MSKLYFITHPSVSINKSIPIDQWQLSNKGIWETERLLKLRFWKKIGLIHTSPERKAVQVARIVAKEYDLKVEINPCLSEVDRSSTGFVEPDLYVELIKEFYMNPLMEVRGWESAERATKRIVECVTNIMDSANKNVAIIGHGATGTLLACHLLKKAPTFTEDPQGVGRLMFIDWDKKKILTRWAEY